MFRKLTREKQRLSKEECLELLINEKRGVLSVIGDEGYPYALPIDFYYKEEDNKIYFHSGKYGHKIDAIKKNDRVSFCVYDEGFHIDGHWSLNIRSVIVFGRISIIEEWPHNIMIDFCKKFTSDIDYIENEIKNLSSSTIMLRLDIEHISGKIVNES